MQSFNCAINSLSDIIWHNKIFLAQQAFQLLNAWNVEQLILKLFTDHRLEKEPNHFDKRRRMNHVELLQVFLEIPVQFFVGVPQEGEWRFADVF